MVREIWCHRNKVFLKGGVVNHSEIFTLAQWKAWSWVTSKIPLFASPFLTGVLLLYRV